MAKPKRGSEWLTASEHKYGLTHGKHGNFFVKGGMPPAPERKPPEPLSAADKAKVAVHANNLKTHAPEFYEFVKEAIKEGMADGLRAVRVKVKTK